MHKKKAGIFEFTALIHNIQQRCQAVTDTEERFTKY